MTYSKIWILPPRTESQAFVRKLSSLLQNTGSAMDFIRVVLGSADSQWLKNREGQFFKKRWTQIDWKREFKFCCILRIIHECLFLPPSHLYYLYHKYSQQLSFKHFVKTMEHEKMNDPSETISTNWAHKWSSEKKEKKKVENNNYFGLLRTSEKLCTVGTFWAISWHESLNCSLFRDKKN